MPVNNVFIIMPFSEQTITVENESRTYTKQHLDDVYSILKEAVQEFRGDILVDRMEQPYGNLVAAIIQRVATADVVIAVLSGKNPNVFYELGVRHSLRCNTVMLVGYWDEYPFDLSSYFSQKFGIDSVADRNELKSFVKARLRVLEDQTLPDSPVLDVLQKSEIEQLKVINTWETRRAALLMEGLSGEVMGILGVIRKAMEDVNELAQHPSSKKTRKINLSWDVIDGFTKTRPIPGLSAIAYRDSEQVYAAWRDMQRLWNFILESRKQPKMEELFQIVCVTDRKTIGYAFDLVTAWDYVMSNRVAYGIPWPNTLDTIEDVVPDVATLQALRSKVAEMLWSEIQRFKRFDHDFIGVPDTILAASRVAEQQAAQKLRELTNATAETTSPIARLLPTRKARRNGRSPRGPSPSKGRSTKRTSKAQKMKK